MKMVNRADAATGAIAFTLTPGIAFQIEEVRLHLNAVGGAGNLTIFNDAGAGVEYDVTFVTQDMTAVQDLVWLPVRPEVFFAGDIFKVSWANAGNKTYGLEVIWSII